MDKHQRHNFHCLANRFKKSFSQYTVSIRCVKMPDGNPADCDKKGINKYKIRIDKNSKYDEALLWLIHEFAHVLSWDKHPDDDHSIYWGNAYSKCYKIYEQFMDELNNETEDRKD